MLHCQPVPLAVMPDTPGGGEVVKSSVTVKGPLARSGPLFVTVKVQVPVPPAVGRVPTVLVRARSAAAMCATAVAGPAV